MFFCLDSTGEGYTHFPCLVEPTAFVLQKLNWLNRQAVRGCVAVSEHSHRPTVLRHQWQKSQCPTAGHRVLAEQPFASALPTGQSFHNSNVLSPESRSALTAHWDTDGFHIPKQGLVTCQGSAAKFLARAVNQVAHGHWGGCTSRESAPSSHTSSLNLFLRVHPCILTSVTTINIPELSIQRKRDQKLQCKSSPTATMSAQHELSTWALFTL